MLLFVNHVIRHRKVGGAFTSSSSPTHTCERDESLASNPGLTRPDFISQQIFLQGGEIKSGRVRPGFEANESLCRCSTNVSMPIGPGCINFWPIKLLLQILHTYWPIVSLFQFCTLLRTRKHDLNTRKHKYKIYCTLVYVVLVQYNNKYMIRKVYTCMDSQCRMND